MQTVVENGSTTNIAAEHARHYSEFQFRQLWKWNLIGGIVHLLQAIIQTSAGTGVSNFRDFKLPLRAYHLAMMDDSYLDITYSNVGNFHIGWAVPVFFYISAIFHFMMITPCMTQEYARQINAGKNYFRWIEYSMSSSVIIWLIAMLFGVYDIALLITIFLMNGVMNLCGAMMERYNNVRDPNSKIDWIPFWVGSLSGAASWIVIFIYLGSAGSDTTDEIPSFVWGVFIGYILFFNTFPINMVLQYTRLGPWNDYIFGEKGYIILSFASKSLLGWLVFGGLNQPNRYTN